MRRGRSVRLLVEGGGSTTRAGLWEDGSLFACAEGPSCNVVSVGRLRAWRHLSELLRQVCAELPVGTGIDTAWCCLSTASSAANIDEASRELLPILSAQCPGVREVWIANDLVPLLVHDGRLIERAVAVCGTGTGFCAINPRLRRCARASGCEYLLSDEGGGFDMGLQGLRAVVRAADGRGPPTELSAALHEWAAVSPSGLSGLVYGSQEPKVLIASFATHVLDAAERGDGCGVDIVRRAATEIQQGIDATARRTGLAAGHEVLLSGSNLTSASNSILRQAVMAQAKVAESVQWVTLAPSPLAAIAQCSRVVTHSPDFVEYVSAAIPFKCFTFSA